MLSDQFLEIGQSHSKIQQCRKPINVEGPVCVIFSSEAELAGIIIMMKSNVQIVKTNAINQLFYLSEKGRNETLESSTRGM